ncbi:hypothetical protein [Staphylococcus phage LY01]|nr:hypothetical protein [Staphylococcus phage LY01]
MSINQYIKNHDFYKIDDRGDIVSVKKDTSKEELNIELFKELFNSNNIKNKIDENGSFSLRNDGILIKDKNTYYRTRGFYIDITDKGNGCFELYFVFSLLRNIDKECKNIGPFKTLISGNVFSYVTYIQIENINNIEYELISNIVNLFNNEKDISLLVYTVNSKKDNVDFITSQEFRKDLILNEYTFNELYEILEKVEDEKEIKKLAVKENFK